MYRSRFETEKEIPCANAEKHTSSRRGVCCLDELRYAHGMGYLSPEHIACHYILLSCKLGYARLRCLLCPFNRPQNKRPAAREAEIGTTEIKFHTVLERGESDRVEDKGVELRRVRNEMRGRARSAACTLSREEGQTPLALLSLLS